MTGRVRRLGPLFLTALLLALPRALGGRALGPQRFFAVQHDGRDPEMEDFARELERALEEELPASAIGWRGDPVQVELHRRWRAPAPGGGRFETLSVSVVQGGRRRSLLVEYPGGRHAGAARSLLKALPSPHLAAC